MNGFAKKEIVFKGVLVVAICFLILDIFFTGCMHLVDTFRINRFLKPKIKTASAATGEIQKPKKEYSKYAEINAKLLKAQESYQLQAVIGDQAIVIFNGSPQTIGVGGRIGEATLTKIEGSIVVLKKDDGTEIKLDMYAGGGPPAPPPPPGAPPAGGPPPPGPASSPPPSGQPPSPPSGGPAPPPGSPHIMMR